MNLLLTEYYFDATKNWLLPNSLSLCMNRFSKEDTWKREKVYYAVQELCLMARTFARNGPVGGEGGMGAQANVVHVSR